MPYRIVMSKQQLQVIQQALNNWNNNSTEVDEFGDNVQEVLQDLTRMTLETEEGDTVHGWVV